MKVIEVGQAPPTLDEVFVLAREGVVVLRQPDGSMFAMAQVDDFDIEAEQLKSNAEFMAYLKHLSQEDATIPIDELRKELGV